MSSYPYNDPAAKAERIAHLKRVLQLQEDHRRYQRDRRIFFSIIVVGVLIVLAVLGRAGGVL